MDYRFDICKGMVLLYKDNYFCGLGELYDSLYRVNLNNDFAESLFCVESNVGIKCSAPNECSAYLWHQKLGHISKGY